MKLANNDPKQDIGVIIGRFQIDTPHEAHFDLIDSVAKLHEKIIIILGLSPLKGMKRNPLNLEARRLMLESDLKDKYPDAILILYCDDMKYNDDWSRKIDDIIQKNIGADHTVALYGSRESFIKAYTTKKYPVYELKSEIIVSGTDLRKTISRKVLNVKEFRTGVIWLSQWQADVCVSFVHLAILNEKKTQILLGKKRNERAYGIIGGIMNPKNHITGEQHALRMITEEIGTMELSNPVYVCSDFFEDWKYRGEDTKPFTTLFKSIMLWGSVPVPNENMETYVELRWFDLNEKLLTVVEEEYKPFIEKLLKA